MHTHHATIDIINFKLQRDINSTLVMEMSKFSSAECLFVYCFCVCIMVALGGGGGAYDENERPRHAYNTGAGVVEGKLNVHLVPHSHLDVGWLKTVDEYYVGTRSEIQDACVENVLDSVVNALLRDPNRKFVFAEMAFFHRWWVTQSLEIRGQVRKLVHDGQLEFVNGGWCMHDEATTHYIDMIDQTTLGHRMIKELFDTSPRAGWQVDPFGHSAVQAYLLGVELGFESVHFARIDHQDRQNRKNESSMEVVWRGSKTFGSSSQIFANIFPNDYDSPKTDWSSLHFEVKGDYVPIQDNHLLFDYNVKRHVDQFIKVAKAQAKFTLTDHIMFTMGGDFQYEYAESWFKQMDKLIHHVNQDTRVNALYSTPSIYTNAKYAAANQSWPLKTGDFFPYADGGYWTGYFSSRPVFKRYVRKLSGYYQATRQLEFMVGRRSTDNTYPLGDALGIAQHHDAISGTAKQHVSDDYTKRLAIGASHAEAVSNYALSCLVSNSPRRNCGLEPKFSQCQLLYMSHCPQTEEFIDEEKSLVVVVYNPLGWHRDDIVRIPVNDVDILVHNSLGRTIEAQFVEIDEVTTNLKNFYLKAYLGHLKYTQDPKFWLYFQVSVLPLGWTTYFISKSAGRENERKSYIPTTENNLVFGPGNLKMLFSLSTGLLNRMYNSKTGVDVLLHQNYFWYNSGSSGAYIFQTDGSNPRTVLQKVPLKFIRGSLVHEVHQQFNSWINQVTRIYKDKDHAEVEYTIGPIPTNDGGKEVVTRMKTSMATEKVFYTDSNGRDFLKRIRDHRDDWTLQVDDAIAGNYYPLNLGIFIKDNNHEFSVLVDRASGGSSIQDGVIEVKLHRRTIEDDGKGVNEPLKEDVCVNNRCQGITVRGNYYMNINRLGRGAHWRRTFGQEIYSPLLLAFTHGNLESWRESGISMPTTTMAKDYVLPHNVALITLQELEDGKVLLRLAHLYEADEDIEHSKLATVELKKVFGERTISDVEETNLSTNQPKPSASTTNKKNWKVVGQNEDVSSPVRGSPFVLKGNYIVELGPMEIRTFLLTFD